MTNIDDALKPAAKGAKRRVRKAIFADRQPITLRMTAALNDHLAAYCSDIKTPANTYVNVLIEIALAKDDPAEMSCLVPMPRSEPKFPLTVRLERALHAMLDAYCERADVSANAFVCGLIQKDLQRKARL